MKKLLFILCSSALFTFVNSCSGVAPRNAKLVVSISPLKYVLGEIVGDDIDIEVIVPDGASPETYSPTSAQLLSIENADVVFVTGLIDFETELFDRISTKTKIHSISKNIELISGSCSHDHQESADQYTHQHHNHGVDPHIWCSPKQLEIIALNILEVLREEYPDSVQYIDAYNKFASDIHQVSLDISARIEASGIEYFIVYHPALTYYARDYGIEQLELETDGKEPSAAHMAALAAKAKADGIRYILYQRQFSQKIVEAFARDAGATPMEIDPLGENVIDEIIRVTNLITE